MNRKVKCILQILLAACLSLYCYTFLHELGHAIVMLSAGAAILDFSILTSHVTAEGGNYTQLSQLLLHANGALLPVVCSFVFNLFYNKNSKNVFYHFFSYLAAVIPIASMIAWVFLPLSYINGKAPVGDDVTHFLDACPESVSPLLVSAVAAAIMVMGIVFMVKKEIFKTATHVVKEIRA